LGPLGTNTPVLGPVSLAPGESQVYFGSYTVPFDTCSVSITALGRNICGTNLVANTVSCPVATVPVVAVHESCPPGPVSAGASVAFTGTVSNPGNITLTNVFVFSSQPSPGAPVLGPITLAPGASAPFAGSYIATGGSNPATNSTIVTNSSGTITTNSVVTFTPTNTVSATGRDICQARTVSAAANCLGPIAQAARASVIGSPTLTNGLWSLSFPTENGKAYTLQYKNRFDDSVWINLGTVAGTGATLSLTDTTGVQPATRFYRVISTPY
jgi:hypothetical protein